MLMVGDATGRACTSVTRRDFLRVGGMAGVSLSMAQQVPSERIAPGRDRALILLLLVGGPSQLETWDPKPHAPAEVRGPFRSISTTVAGIRINEHLPRLARRMGRLTVIRSLHHDAAPIHETGHQLVQTGKLCPDAREHPHIGSVVARRLGAQNNLPPFVVLPGPIGKTGVGISHGQTAGPLGHTFEPFHLETDPASTEFDAAELFARAQQFLVSSPALSSGVAASASYGRSKAAPRAFDLDAEPAAIRAAYGKNTFGQSCLLARRLVESGVRVVTVNMFETVFNRVTWDCHGSRPFSTLDDYSAVVLPTFDMAFSALLDDLDDRGLLDTTLVVATGEFGRTPRLNAAGGRDHWPGVWSAALAGGGIRGGQVIGASDRNGGEPVDRPVNPAEFVATMYQSLGIDPKAQVLTSDGSSISLTDSSNPIKEAFA
jgi:uncharacterized protein (DUF1501 family)